MQKLCLLLFSALLLLGVCFTPSVQAASGAELDARVNDAMKKFYKEVPGARDLVAKSRGVLVMPKVYKAGFMIGGEYGEGALRVGGKTVDYYNMVSGSYGFQIGAQKKTVILIFMDSRALQNFRNSAGWEVGADASVAMVTVGAEGTITSDTLNKPIVGFVTNQKGLMAGISLEGAKFSKLDKSGN